MTDKTAAAPRRKFLHKYANDFARKVSELTGNRLKIEVLPSGAVALTIGWK